MGGSISPSDYHLNINMIGENLYLLNLYLTRNIYTKTKSINKKKIISIFDFWDFNYKFNTPIDKQIEYAFNIYEKNKKDNEINSKEVLIVHIKNKNSELVHIILSKMEKLKRPHYMPLVLFLSDQYNGELDNIIPDKNLYLNIIPTTIETASFIDDKDYLFESEENELTQEGENKMEIIKNILLRFCSYHNDLGDRFSIGKGNKTINYDLTKKYYPFTINICCIGRFGKGKSTCVNCLLGEPKAKESKSGASTTKKINYYQISDQPIKIYDIPGFENEETTSNAILKLKELNDEINELKEQLHFILYIIKSSDERMFADIEYKMLNEIFKQKDSKLLYILTHSSKDIDKEEKIDMINVGIKNILRNNKCINLDETFSKLRANEDNCIFVNFHPFGNTPVYGINEIFKKLSILVKDTKIYKKYTKKNMTNNDYKRLIEEEANVRKAKAEKILIYNSIGAGLVGAIPGVDLAVQKLVIQKQATKKIGQIFGLDINLIKKEEKLKNKVNDKDNNFEIIKNNNNNGKSKFGIVSNIGPYVNSSSSAATLISTGNYLAETAQLSTEVTVNVLRGVSISFLFVGVAIGVTTGFFFTYRHCQKLIKQLYNYFIENIRELSNSIIQAQEYLEKRSKLDNNE